MLTHAKSVLVFGMGAVAALLIEAYVMPKQSSVMTPWAILGIMALLWVFLSGPALKRWLWLRRQPIQNRHLQIDAIMGPNEFMASSPDDDDNTVFRLFTSDTDFFRPSISIKDQVHVVGRVYTDMGKGRYYRMLDCKVRPIGSR